MSDAADEAKSGPAKPRWPLWKKLAIVGAVLLVVIPLAVGLGVGLTRNKGSSGDDNNNDDNNDNSDGGNSTATPRPSLWTPEAGVSWQIVLLKPITADAEGDFAPDEAEVYDVDLFDNDAETFKQLHDAGKKVICYFSAGSYEDWREDADEFAKEDLGSDLDGWPGEKWVRLSGASVRKVMRKRIALAAEKGCDGIDPDNVDGYQNDNGLGLKESDTVDFVKFLAAEALKLNMSTGLKNAGGIIPQVLDDVHFSVNEQCVEYSECETFAPFIEAGKPVFHIEYPDGAPNVARSKAKEVCSGSGAAAGASGFSTVIKKMNLDGWVEYCDEKTFTTETTQ